MKIAMIGHKQFPSRSGGVEIVVQELSTRMVIKGHDVTLFNRYHIDNPDKNILTSFQGVKIKKAYTLSNVKFDAFLSSFSATVLALFGDYDVIHYHAEGPSAMAWLPKLLGKRVICTNHGLDWQRAKWGGFATKYLKFGEKVSAKFSNELIVLSESIQKYFQNKYLKDTVLIPNGVEAPIFKDPNIISKEFGLDKEGYILALVRLVPEKGIHYLIEAYKDIETDKKLVIAGAGTIGQSYEKQIRDLANDNKNIIFTGFVDLEIARELYSNAYIYVLPSDVEGLPIGLLEAMSYCNCCLVSDIQENIDVIKDTGKTFSKGNVQSLKENLEQLLYNPKKIKSLGREAQIRALNNYSWDEIVEETLEIYLAK